MQANRTLWTFAITSVALFMVTLDNLVVTTAIPVIRDDLDASLESLEWTVNAYTLTFAVLLLTGAALGDRFGRRRVFAIGVGIFTLGSIAAALAPIDRGAQPRARRAGARRRDRDAAHADDPQRRRPAGAARPRPRRLGRHRRARRRVRPVVGGAVVEGLSWQWIFWLNVPIGLVLIPLALARLTESYGPGGTARPARARRSPAPACSAIVWGARARQRRGLDEPGDRRLARLGAAARRRRSSPGSCARARRCCRCASSATPAFALAERGVAVHVLRHVRLDLPARAVLPDRAGLLAARLGAADPAVDARADVHRADRRARSPTGSPPAAHRRRPVAAGGRARLDRARLDADDPVLRAGRALHPGRRRDGALLRAGRRTSCSRRCGRRRRARRRAPTTRSASSAASSASPCSPRCSRTPAATRAAEAFVDGMNAAVLVGAAVVGLGSARGVRHPGPASALGGGARRTRAELRPQAEAA